MKTLEVLFIDDHPMILEGYKTTLERCDKYKVNVHIKTSIDDAYRYIIEDNPTDKFDVIFYDISMPESVEYNIKNGIQLAIEVKKKIQHPKTVFLTMINDQFQIDNIINDINPEGILVKNDISPNTLISSFIEIVTSPPCYSSSILSKTKRTFSLKSSIDKTDQAILYYISKGKTTKNLKDVVNLSISTIEKRKRRIKILFGVEKESDFALIEEAKNRGFL